MIWHMERGLHARCSKGNCGNTWTDYSEHQAIELRTTKANFMNKLLLALGLVAFTTLVQAQGTINPLNGTLTRLKWDSNGNGVIDSNDNNLTTADGLRLGVFWGAAGGPADTLAGVMTIGSTSGIMVGLPAIFALPGAGDVGTVVSLEIRVVDSLEWCGRTGVKQVALAPAAGPGTVIWSSSANASRFSPMLIYPCPEPSTLALGALGGLVLLFQWRRSGRKP